MTKYLTINDAIKRIDELEDKIKRNYIDIIKKFGDKYSDEELAKEDLESLETIIDACSRFADMPSEGKPVVIPFGNKMNKKTGELNRRIDFARVFDDVNAKFNMSNLKSETKK